MTRLNPKHLPLSLKTAHRLIVLVPCTETDLTAVTNRVWELANATGAHIKFLDLRSDSLRKSSPGSKLDTMPAIVNFGNVSAEVEVIFERDWVDAVKSLWREDDILVCFDECRTGSLQKPLSQILQSDLALPLYILSGFSPQSNEGSIWWSQLIMWIGFIAIVLGLFMLQIKIEQFARHGTVILELLSTAVEFWLIWAWNKLF